VYRQVRKLPKVMEETLQITAYQPNQYLVVSGGFAYFQGQSAYLLEVHPDGTKLTNNIEIHAHGVLDILSALSLKGIKHAVAQNMVVLKGLLESSIQSYSA
jgi:hypothetical protein